MWRDLLRRRFVREPAPSTYDGNRALELLRLATGDPDAQFREGQEEAIRHVVDGRGRLLVVQRTGWGKSFVYFIATRLLRESGGGPALLVSPLLSLMRNQMPAAQRIGIRAATINSANTEDWSGIEGRVRADEIDILLISPERLANDRFQEEVLSHVASRISLLVVDEAHCISDWGHDFRPHYRLISRVARSLPANLRLLATTATANNRVIRDLNDVLGPRLQVSRGDLARNSLTLQTVPLLGPAERLAWLDRALRQIDGSGIIYTLTVRDAEMVSGWLKSRGHNVVAYSSRSGEARPLLEADLLANRVKALVATLALGMGFDKPDLAFVIHYQSPESVVAYYQQVGRAGRAIDSAYGVLLSGAEDRDIHNYFIQESFPSQEEADRVLGAIRLAPRGLTEYGLQCRLNMAPHRIRQTLSLLSLESPAPITSEEGRWQITSVRLGSGFRQRAQRLSERRKQEFADMERYVRLPFGRHMQFLVKALDGDPSTVKPPALPPLPTDIDPDLVRSATLFLQGESLEVAPRDKWPAAGMPSMGVSGEIGLELRAEVGRALCTWGDGGWGQVVRHGKYTERRFDDALVTACANLVHDWRPRPEPMWVTAMPSLRHPTLVPDLAHRIADRLGLPFYPALYCRREHAEQKTMANSVHQARNLDGAIGVEAGLMGDGPVLLVDDMVDSRWSLTVAAYLLRREGSGPVWPLVLSTTGKHH